MKTYTVTIQTTGYITYEVKAVDEDDAREKIKEGKGTVAEESYGDYLDNEWEFEVSEEE